MGMSPTKKPTECVTKAMGPASTVSSRPSSAWPSPSARSCAVVMAADGERREQPFPPLPRPGGPQEESGPKRPEPGNPEKDSLLKRMRKVDPKQAERYRQRTGE